MEITDDYIITFDIPIDAGTASSAITFDPDVSNRTDTWDEDGLELTISFDDLPYSTDHVVSVSTAIAGTNGLNMLADTSFTFKTLPEPPTVDYTFPTNLAVDVPVNTPFELQFSKGMVPDSVEKAIEFTPAVEIQEYIWNADNSILYFSTDELTASTQYFVTVGTVATDRFSVQLAEPFQFVFTTAAPVSVDNRNSPKMVVYPNPADEHLLIKGVDVKSVKIYNMTGQLVREVSNSSELNISNIETGIYIIDVSDQQDKRYKEVILIK
jgi:hypothetical protein